MAITVLTPVYKHHKFLSGLIQALEQQEHSNWKLWILNDQPEIKIDNLSAKKITIFNKGHIGKVAQLNYAIPKVETEYIAFIDADDIPLPNRLHIYDYDFIYSDAIGIRKDDIQFSMKSYSLIDIFQVNPCIFSTITIKTEIAQRIVFENGYRGYGEDWEWILKLYKLGYLENSFYRKYPTIYFRTYTSSSRKTKKIFTRRFKRYMLKRKLRCSI